MGDGMTDWQREAISVLALNASGNWSVVQVALIMGLSYVIAACIVGPLAWVRWDG